MTQADSSNTGVFFAPNDDQSFVGQGKLNMQGRDGRIAILREPVKRDGAPQLVVYRKIGVLFPNEKQDNDRSPDYSGPLEIDNLRIAGWRGEKDGRAYMSLRVSTRDPQPGGLGAPIGPEGPPVARSAFPEDEVPF